MQMLPSCTKEKNRKNKEYFFYRIFAFLALAAILSLVFSNIYISTNSQYIPYLITVDKQGLIVTNNNLEKLSTIPKNYIASELCQFIKNTHEVLNDKSMQENAIFKSYAFINTEEMTAKLDKHFKENNPFILQKDKNIYVNINNIIEKSKNSYEIDFTEFHQYKYQDPKKKKQRALISYKTINVDSLSSRELLLNPLGIVIDDIFISEYMES